jgi:ATP-dependent Clp protease ATP-binding subunit ClpA
MPAPGDEPPSIGFVQQDHSTDGMEAILKKMFSPEFRNRSTRSSSSAAGPQAHRLRVVDKFLIELEAQLDEKNVCRLDRSFDEAARALDRRQGLRPEDGCAADGR